MNRADLIQQVGLAIKGGNPSDAMIACLAVACSIANGMSDTVGRHATPLVESVVSELVETIEDAFDIAVDC